MGKTDDSVMDNFYHHPCLAICHLEVPGSNLVRRCSIHLICCLLDPASLPGSVRYILCDEQIFERTQFRKFMGRPIAEAGMIRQPLIIQMSALPIEPPAL